jgi:hypothetical protein
MSPTTPRKRSRSRKKTKRSFLVLWWPLLLALIATPFAVRAASVFALTGPVALRLLYPFVALVQAHASAQFSGAQRDTLAEWTMWTQFPVYGLLFALIGRWRSLLAALLTVLLLHVAAVAAASL